MVEKNEMYKNIVIGFLSVILFIFIFSYRGGEQKYSQLRDTLESIRNTNQFIKQSARLLQRTNSDLRRELEKERNIAERLREENRALEYLNQRLGELNSEQRGAIEGLGNANEQFAGEIGKARYSIKRCHEIIRELRKENEEE